MSKATWASLYPQPTGMFDDALLVPYLSLVATLPQSVAGPTMNQSEKTTSVQWGLAGGEGRGRDGFVFALKPALQPMFVCFP